MRRASPSTGRGAGGSSTRCCARRAGSVPGSVIAGGDSHTCTLRRARRVRHRPRIDRHRGVPRVRRVLAGGAGARSGSSSPARSGAFVTGKDLILAVIDEIGVGGGDRTPCSSSSARARRRCRSTSGWPWPTWPSRPARRPACSPPTRRPRRTWTGRTDGPWTAERTDPDAEFAPERAGSTSTSSAARRASALAGQRRPRRRRRRARRIDQVYIGNCANGTMTDLRQAAEILRGRRVHRDCRMIVVPATQRIYREALAEGLLDVFVEAGAMVSTPTCGACFGGGMGVLGAGRAGDRHHQPQLPRPDGLARAPRSTSRTRRWPRRRRSPARSSIPAELGAVIIEGRAVRDRRATTSTPT